MPKSTLAFLVCAVVLSIALMRCRASEKGSQGNVLPVAIVQSKLGKNYAVAYNASKSFALCQQEPEGGHVKRIIRYLVVRLSDHAVVYEGQFQAGSVRWHDDQSIEVYNSSGTRDDQAGDSQIINIVSRQL